MDTLIINYVVLRTLLPLTKIAPYMDQVESSPCLKHHSFCTKYNIFNPSPSPTTTPLFSHYRGIRGAWMEGGDGLKIFYFVQKE